MSQLNTLGQPIGEAVPGWTPRPQPPREPLQGRLCRLEPLTPERHVPDLWEAYALDAEGRNWTYLIHGPYVRKEELGAWAEGAASTRDPLFFAVVTPAESGAWRATGVASYLRIAPEVGSIEVGHINFSPKLQRTPAATEAMFLMMQRAFDLGYRRYEWKCDALNAPSRAAAERLGLSFEGVFRQALVYKGRNRDSAWYAAIDTEWPALRRAFEQWLASSNFDGEGRQRVSLSSLTAPILVSRG